MADVHSKAVRSFNMSQIRSKDTKPEMIVRRFLHGKGFRFRLHDKRLPGKPDLVFKKHKAVIFINGCFWHGHAECKYYVIPKSNTEWWLNKIKGNIETDHKAIEKLKATGWLVITIWECELKKDKLTNTLSTLPDRIKNEIRAL